VDDVSGTAALGAAGSGAPAAAWARGGVGGRVTRSAERVCARPACRAPATATLGFSYAAREVELTTLARDPAPQTYDLCTVHAARTRPPHGWQLRDRRPDDDRRPDARGAVPADLGGDRTVAVLAAALRAVPGAVSEDATAAPAAEVTATHPVDGPGADAATVAAAVETPDAGAGASTRQSGPTPRPVPGASRARSPQRRTG